MYLVDNLLFVQNLNEEKLGPIKFDVSWSTGIGLAVLDNRRVVMCDFGDEPAKTKKQILLTTLRKY